MRAMESRKPPQRVRPTRRGARRGPALGWPHFALGVAMAAGGAVLLVHADRAHSLLLLLAGLAVELLGATIVLASIGARDRTEDTQPEVPASDRQTRPSHYDTP